jgi:sugar lactone lactonase YvrE
VTDLDLDDRPRRTRIALIAVLVVLALLLVGLVTFVVRIVEPAGRPQGRTDTPVGLEWVRSLYGFGPKLSDQLLDPTGATVAPDGTIYGTDPQRGRILAFNPDGSFRTLVHTGPPGAGVKRLYRPMTAGTDADGNLYVCEYGNNRIMVFSSAGAFIREWDVPAPTSVCVSGSRVYVTTVYGVAVFSTDGALLSLWGSRGRGPDQFDNPRGIAVGADGTVYVTDTLNARLKAYTADGTLLWVWPADRAQAKPSGIRPGSDAGPLQVPTGAVIDGQGRLVIVDAFAFKILVFKVDKKTATPVANYGDVGRKDGFFANPSDIGYDAGRDWFVVADTSNNRLQIVRIPGSASNALTAGVRRALTGAPWLCWLPLFLLLVAVVLAVLRSRTRARAAEAGVIDDVVADTEASVSEDEM